MAFEEPVFVRSFSLHKKNVPWSEWVHATRAIARTSDERESKVSQMGRSTKSKKDT